MGSGIKLYLNWSKSKLNKRDGTKLHCESLKKIHWTLTNINLIKSYRILGLPTKGANRNAKMNSKNSNPSRISCVALLGEYSLKYERPKESF